MSDRYVLKVNERQLRVIQQALDIYSRLGIGQWRDAFDHLPLRKDLNYGEWNNFLDRIGGELRTHTKGYVDGYQSSLGISGEHTSESSRVAWDLYQVIRHRLSWDRAVKDGVIESLDSPRMWSAMLSVDYDDPFQYSEEPLPEIDHDR